MGPAIWLSDSKAAKFHQRIIINFRPNRTRAFARTNIFISIIAWYSIFAWWYLLRAYFYQPKHNGAKPLHKLITDLCYLSFWIGVNPRAYFTLKLYRFNCSMWLNYIYPLESQHWYSSQSLDCEKSTIALLNDKVACNEFLASHGLKSTETIAHFCKGDELTETDCFIGKSVFIKPNNARGMRGCVRLTFDVINQKYHLYGYDMKKAKIDLVNVTDILYFLNQMSQETELIMQSLIIDHEKLQKLGGDHDITTLRIVSCQHNQNIMLFVAAIEIPCKKGWPHYVQYAIEIETGIIRNQQNITDILKQEPRIPYWPQVHQLVISAHQALGSIRTVGWDVCVTDKGPMIIEGNAGWGVMSLQKVISQPLLTGCFLNAYSA